MVPEHGRRYRSRVPRASNEANGTLLLLRMRAAVLGVAIALCGALRFRALGPQKSGRRPCRREPGNQGQPAVGLPELNESLTETLADTYVIAIAEGIDAMQTNQGSAEARRQAQRVKVFVGTTAYSLATNPNPEIFDA